MSRHGKFVWTGLFLLIAVYFGFFEWKALSEPDGLTLSRLIYNTWHAWPLLGPLIGIFVGVLLSHFFWEWSPKLQAAQKTIADLAAQVRDEKARADDLEVQLEAARQRVGVLEARPQPQPQPKAKPKTRRRK